MYLVRLSTAIKHKNLSRLPYLGREMVSVVEEDKHSELPIELQVEMGRQEVAMETEVNRFSSKLLMEKGGSDYLTDMKKERAEHADSVKQICRGEPLDIKKLIALAQGKRDNLGEKLLMNHVGIFKVNRQEKMQKESGIRNITKRFERVFRLIDFEKQFAHKRTFNEVYRNAGRRVTIYFYKPVSFFEHVSPGKSQDSGRSAEVEMQAVSGDEQALISN